MNVFFISPSVNLDQWVNYGIATLSGLIKHKGHEVDLYQPTKSRTNELYAQFQKKHYDLCLVSCVTNQWPYSLRCIKSLKKISHVPVIVGGHHATSCPAILEENTEIDGICLGEGDLALGRLLDSLESGKTFDHIQNMWFRHGDEIVRNELGPLVDNLDDLPLPDYSVFSRRAISNRPSIMLSRGCPYGCTYCCNNYLRKIYSGKGKYTRKKSVQKAIEEVKDFIDRYHPIKINFDDDTFVKDKEWVSLFLEGYKNITDTPFDCNTRAETLDEEICKSLKEAHCDTLCIGIECGNEQFRKTVYGRHMTNDALIKAFDLLRRHNIKSYAFNIVGSPDETYENYMETVRLNRLLRPDDSQITIFYPYPATDLCDYAKQKGYFENSRFRDSFVSGSLLRMTQFPPWKITYAKTLFKYHVWSENKTCVQKFFYLSRHLLEMTLYRIVSLVRRYTVH